MCTLWFVWLGFVVCSSSGSNMKPGAGGDSVSYQHTYVLVHHLFWGNDGTGCYTCVCMCGSSDVEHFTYVAQ